jgi:hypothetical protein
LSLLVSLYVVVYLVWYSCWSCKYVWSKITDDPDGPKWYEAIAILLWPITLLAMGVTALIMLFEKDGAE